MLTEIRNRATQMERERQGVKDVNKSEKENGMRFSIRHTLLRLLLQCLLATFAILLACLLDLWLTPLLTRPPPSQLSALPIAFAIKTVVSCCPSAVFIPTCFCHLLSSCTSHQLVKISRRILLTHLHKLIE